MEVSTICGLRELVGTWAGIHRAVFGSGRDAHALEALAIAAPPRPTCDRRLAVTEGAPGGGFTPLGIGRRTSLRCARRGPSPWDFGRAPSPSGPRAVRSTPIVVDGRSSSRLANRVIASTERGSSSGLRPGVWRGVISSNIGSIAASRTGAIATPRFRGRARLPRPLDARSSRSRGVGVLCGFGAGGPLNLLEGVAPVYDEREYNVTSPGTVVGDVIVVGSSIADIMRPDAPAGDVRAFDVRSGALRWTFHTIPHAGEAGHETWETGTALTGAANVWSTITADLARGWVFLPVSTPSPDFYGGDRLGANWFSDSVVALDAHTGRRIWHFQTVHHDLWDYDLAAPPVLATLERDGKPVDAVVQATKHGFVFVLDRATGAPLFPVEERPVPASDVPASAPGPPPPGGGGRRPLVPSASPDDDLYAPTPEHLAPCR